jgi:hypothetical protein
MHKPRYSRTVLRTLLSMTAVVAALMVTGCAIDSTWSPNARAKASDPHLTGKRDLSYDHLIVPGNRIGPVKLGGSVSEAVRHLGEPDHISRSTFRGPGYSSDEVTYHYKEECISFTWIDSGIDPEIENGWRGINVNCDKWSTRDGVHVGASMKDAVAHINTYCPTNRDDGSLLIITKEGIWFEGKDRNSPIWEISVMPAENTWGGVCKD